MDGAHGNDGDHLPLNRAQGSALLQAWWLVLGHQRPSLRWGVHHRPEQAEAGLPLRALDRVPVQRRPILSSCSLGMQVGEDQPWCFQLTKAPTSTFGRSAWQFNTLGGERPVQQPSAVKVSITFRPPLGLLTPRSTTTSAASPWSWMKLARGASWLLLTAEIDRTSGIFCCSGFNVLLLLNEGLLKRVTLTWQPRKRSIWKTNKGSSGWHIISSRLLICRHAEFDNSSVGKSSRTKRRATGGRQDGLCLRNRQSLEKMTGGQLETFGRVIFRDLLRYFRPLRHGMGWPKILQEVKVLSPGIWGCERNMERIFIEIHSKSEIGSKVRVPKCCATNHPLYGDNQESFPCFSNNHTIVNWKASYWTFILCFADVPKSQHNITLNHMTLIVHYFSHWWWTKQSKSMQLHNKLL